MENVQSDLAPPNVTNHPLGPTAIEAGNESCSRKVLLEVARKVASFLKLAFRVAKFNRV